MANRMSPILGHKGRVCAYAERVYEYISKSVQPVMHTIRHDRKRACNVVGVSVKQTVLGHKSRRIRISTNISKSTKELTSISSSAVCANVQVSIVE